MNLYNLTHDVKVFGMEVKTFPLGISDTFENLAKMLSDGFERQYYGISYFNSQGNIIYKAATEEKYEGEPGKYGLEQYLISKGEYLTVPVKGWREKLGSIKDVFHELMSDPRVSKSSECIEWYKDNDEMLCMVRTA